MTRWMGTTLSGRVVSVCVDGSNLFIGRAYGERLSGRDAALLALALTTGEHFTTVGGLTAMSGMLSIAQGHVAIRLRDDDRKALVESLAAFAEAKSGLTLDENKDGDS